MVASARRPAVLTRSSGKGFDQATFRVPCRGARRGVSVSAGAVMSLAMIPASRPAVAASWARCRGCASVSAPSCSAVPTTTATGGQGGASRPQERAQRAAAAGLPLRRSRGHAGIHVLVGQREHHLRERDAVRDRVVNPEQHRTAVFAVTLDQVGMPERPRAVERRSDQIADQLLQRLPVPRRRQREPVHVLVDVETGIRLEPRQAAERLGDPGREARELVDDAAPEQLPCALPVDRLLEPDHGIDHHGVGRPVHVQPGRVRIGHRAAAHVAPGVIARCSNSRCSAEAMSLRARSTASRLTEMASMPARTRMSA